MSNFIVAAPIASDVFSSTVIAPLIPFVIIIFSGVTETDGKISYYPLFGIKGKTLAGGISKNLNMKNYMPEKNFNTRYKGYGLYGVGAPRADYLGTVKINAPLALSERKAA